MNTNSGNHGPIIGIDFGTTKTMVAEYDPVRKFAKVRKLGRSSDDMPTSMYVTDADEVFFGEDADEEGMHDAPKHIRRFKMLLGKATETQFGSKAAKPTDLAAEFLSHLRRRLETEVFHRSVEHVVLTVPAMFGQAQRKDLTLAAERAGFKKVELLAEPVAAGIAYCELHTDLSKNLRFLVVDWGGGTFDLALVERNGADECKALLEYLGSASEIGGEDLDDEFWIAVSEMIKDTGSQPLELQPKHEWGKYRRELTRAKEGLSTKNNLIMSFTLDGGKLVRIPIDRSKLEEVIHEKVHQGARQVAELVARCRKNGCVPDFILLAGGTSRIPMIAILLEQVAGLPCRTWSEGRDAIALGAAIHAHRIFESPANLQESAATQSSSTGEKFSAMSQYKSLLEGAWIDGVISNDERVFLGKKRKELNLSIEESQAIQIQVLGATIGDVIEKNEATSNELKKARTSLVQAINQIHQKNTPFKIHLEKSAIGLQVFALASEAHADMNEKEFMEKTHFPIAYSISIENTTSTVIQSARVTLKSSDGQGYSIIIPSIPPAILGGRRLLTSLDFGGKKITKGDTVSVEAEGVESALLFVIKEECRKLDDEKAIYDNIPCNITVRKAAFSSNFVLKITNIQRYKIKIMEFKSPAGSISSPIEIEPDATAEIGFCELSENRNLAAGEEFLISIEGFRNVRGVIAEGQLKGGNGVWAVLGALGGLALVAAGG
jgi:actin-like ATPase involved in cell morphogenesis